MTCPTCEIAGGAVDYKCADCCVRLLGTLPNRQLVAAHMRSMERFNADEPGFSNRLQAKWKAVVDQRRVKGERNAI